MVLLLLNDPQTDFVASLEEKVAGSKYEDRRMVKALENLAKRNYDLHDFYTQLCLLDNAWTMKYLAKKVGRKDLINSADSFLIDYNPFHSFNPVVKGMAYLQAMEDTDSIKELDYIIDGAHHYLGDDDYSDRMEVILEDFYMQKRNYLEREFRYRKKVTSEIFQLTRKGDNLIKEWKLSEASYLYKRASELAKYQLGDNELAEGLEEKFKHVSQKLLKK